MSALGLSGWNEDRLRVGEGWIDTPAEGWNSIVLIKTKPSYPLSYSPSWLVPPNLFGTLCTLGPPKGTFWGPKRLPNEDWVLVNRHPRSNQDKADSPWFVLASVLVHLVYLPFLYPSIRVYRSCMSTVRVCLPFVYVYRSCMSSVRVCLPFVYVYRSFMSTVCVCLPFFYVYHSCMSTVGC